MEKIIQHAQHRFIALGHPIPRREHDPDVEIYAWIDEKLYEQALEVAGPVEHDSELIEMALREFIRAKSGQMNPAKSAD
ncbi:hypothetical protein FQZ97_906790 [compost metagenome]